VITGFKLSLKEKVRDIFARAKKKLRRRNHPQPHSRISLRHDMGAQATSDMMARPFTSIVPNSRSLR
jgi:hypothetical protein